MCRDRPAECRARPFDRHSRAHGRRRQQTRPSARRSRVSRCAWRTSVKRNLSRIVNPRHHSATPAWKASAVAATIATSMSLSSGAFASGQRDASRNMKARSVMTAGITARGHQPSAPAECDGQREADQRPQQEEGRAPDLADDGQRRYTAPSETLQGLRTRRRLDGSLRLAVGGESSDEHRDG